MSTFTLDVQPRSVLGKQVKQLRAQGLLPATIYGKGLEPVSVQIDARTFNTTFRRAGRTQLIEVTLPGRPAQSVFVQDVQRHPVSRAIIHVDLRVVDLKKAMNMDVPVVLIGESPLVKRGDGLINQALTMVTIHALPAEVPQHIEVDISGLVNFDNVIHVRDLPVGGKFTLISDADDVVVSLVQIRAAEEEPVAEEGEPAEPELVKRGRKDEGEEE